MEGVDPGRSDAPLVLVVDDEASVREALERALRLEGFAVSTAGGGREALEQVEASSPSVVVLDVTMPDLDGIAVVKEMALAGLMWPSTAAILSGVHTVPGAYAAGFSK